jgi:hypothetical protein
MQLNGKLMLMMENYKLKSTNREHVCHWCFEKDHSVLRHAESGTYWHSDCFDRAREGLIYTLPWLRKTDTASDIMG